MPKISVIIPVYQVEKYLERCVDSILQQTFHDYECILIDDGSTDKSGYICDQYARIYTNFSVIHKQNGGLSSARNMALQRCHGDYICFLDSDDLLHPQALEIMIKAAEDSMADMVTAKLLEFSASNVEASAIKSVNTKTLSHSKVIANLYPSLFGEISVTACGKLYRKEIFETIRFPEGEIYEDLHVYLDILLLCEKIALIDAVLYFYYKNPDSITRSNYLAHNRFGEFQVRERYISFFKKKKLFVQAQYAENDYLTFFMRNYFAVNIKYPHLRKKLKPDVLIFKQHLKDILHNSFICRMRKVCSVLMLLSPDLAWLIARKCIPDCLLEEMQ